MTPSRGEQPDEAPSDRVVEIPPGPPGGRDDAGDGGNVANPPPPSKALSYARLFRLPNVFTALADVLMGYLFTHPSLEPLQVSIPLLLASALVYMAGMTLNDVADVEVDRAEAPVAAVAVWSDRVAWARLLGWQMLLAGAMLGVLASSMLSLAEHHFEARPGGVAIGLAVLVVLYNRLLKRTPLGPLAMGGCRFLNVLLGMSAAIDPLTGAAAPWTAAHFIVAGGIGLYVVGVSWFARYEMSENVRRLELFGAVGVMLAGIGALAVFPSVEGARALLTPRVAADPDLWRTLCGAMAVWITWRCIRAAIWTYTEFFEEAIKQCLMSIITLDAIVCFAVHDVFPWTVVVFLLVVPMIFLGRYVYST